MGTTRIEQVEGVGSSLGSRWIAVAIVGAVVSLAAPATAMAHAGFVEPPPRTTESLIGAPCGQGEVTGPRTMFEAGETVYLQWEEFISHGGYYRLAFSPNDDAGFDDNVLGIVDEGDAAPYYELAVEFPNCTCDDCTVQLFQTPGSGGYYSCADIELYATEENPAEPCPMAIVEEDDEGTTGGTGGTGGSGGGEGAQSADGGGSGGEGLDDGGSGGGGPGADDAGDDDGGDGTSGGGADSDRDASTGCAIGERGGPWALALSLPLLLCSSRRRVE